MTGLTATYQPTYPSNLKGQIEMAIHYHIPLLGPFYCPGRVGPGHWFSNGNHNGFVLARRERVTVEG